MAHAWRVKYVAFYNYGAGTSRTPSESIFVTAGKDLEEIERGKREADVLGNVRAHIEIVSAEYLGPCEVLGES